MHDCRLHFARQRYRKPLPLPPQFPRVFHLYYFTTSSIITINFYVLLWCSRYLNMSPRRPTILQSDGKTVCLLPYIGLSPLLNDSSFTTKYSPRSWFGSGRPSRKGTRRSGRDRFVRQQIIK